MKLFDFEQLVLFEEFALWLCTDGFNVPGWVSKALVPLLLIYWLMCFPLFVGVLILSLFCHSLFCVHSSFAITLKRKRKLVALLLLSYRCIVAIHVLWLFLTVLWVGL